MTWLFELALAGLVAFQIIQMMFIKSLHEIICDLRKENSDLFSKWASIALELRDSRSIPKQEKGEE